jgi:hypothetical protein
MAPSARLLSLAEECTLRLMKLRGVAILGLVLLPIAVRAGSPEVPAVMDEQWIAADHAITVDGARREEMLGQHTRRLRELARKNTARGRDRGAPFEDCQISTQVDLRDPQRTSSIDRLTRNAGAIVAAKVLATRPGFLGGSPGTMLLLEPRYLKGPQAQELYLFYPLAKIRTKEGMICASPFGDFFAPQRGDRVLIFSLVKPAIRDGHAILSVDVSQQLVHETRGGRVFAPDALRAATPAENASFEAIERKVAATMMKHAHEE